MEQAITKTTIETQRLLLREITAELLQEVVALPDEEAKAYLGVDDAGLAAERDKVAKGVTTYRISILFFLLVSKETGKVIGRCGYHNWYAQHSRAELGYAMDNEEVKSKGYMKEALAAIVRYGFRQMGLNRIEAFVGPGNEPSLKLVRGLGFTQDGWLRQHYNTNGDLQDSLCFGLLKEEWEAAINISK